jgi:hypothetical protein
VTQQRERPRQRGSDRQQVVDPDHACNYSRVPHLLLDHAAEGKLGGSAITLYLHYKRLAYELHGRPMAESLRETKRRTGLSNGTILAARGQLRDAGWLRVNEQREGEPAVITLIERWEENCHGHTAAGGQNLTTPGRNPAASGQKPAAGGRILTTSNLRNDPIKTEDLKDPVTGDERECARVVGQQRPLASMATVTVDACSSRICAGAEIFEGLYRGLGVDASTLTPTQTRLERRIADAMAEHGVTGEEAEAYARETNVPGRRAAVNMQSFERDCASWLSRRRQTVLQPLLRVANGRIPE